MDNFTLASFLHLAMRVLLVGGLVTFLLLLGERAFGFSIRGVIDNVEKQAKKGDVWPATCLLIAGILAIAYILG